MALAYVLIAVVLLWKGADILVDAAANIARRWNVSELVIGLTLVALGTSAPEFAVSIGAALAGQSDISVGNIVGSNTFNLGFILGGCAAMRAIATHRTIVRRDGLFLLAITIVFTVLIRDLELSRQDGVIMCILLIAYSVVLFRYRQDTSEPTEEIHPAASLWVDLLKTAVSLVMVMGGAKLLVDGASSLAREFGMSEWAIGVTIVAAGTSAPELVTAFNATLKGKHGISAGGLIGSDIYNILGVLGVASLIKPLGISDDNLSSVYIMVLMVALVLLFMRTQWRISRWEGLVLIAINIVRWWWDVAGGQAQ
ncbi:MAG: calcium/sodium antiporter [Myxococcota bacterium]